MKLIQVMKSFSMKSNKCDQEPLRLEFLSHPQVVGRLILCSPGLYYVIYFLLLVVIYFMVFLFMDFIINSILILMPVVIVEEFIYTTSHYYANSRAHSY